MDANLLPVDDNYITILGIINALELRAANELSAFLNSQFVALGKAQWFEEIKQYRLSQNEPFTYKSPKDLRFILGESSAQDSQIWHLIPNAAQVWFNAANTLRLKLNLFHHQQLAPTLNTLLQMSTLFDQVATAPGLEVAAWAKALQTRTKSILDGTFHPQVAAPQPTVPAGSEEVLEQYEVEIKKQVERPAWGARWAGEKPERKLTLDRNTRDIYNSNGVSVKQELGDLANHVISIWLQYFPRGGEVWVAEDGATMGYIKGLPKMIGWFGASPDEASGQVRGFALEHDYELVENDIKHLSSELLLSKTAIGNVAALISSISAKTGPGTVINITDYGDIFIPALEGQPVRLAHAHKDVWFHDHLPGS